MAGGHGMGQGQQEPAPPKRKAAGVPMLAFLLVMALLTLPQLTMPLIPLPLLALLSALALLALTLLLRSPAVHVPAQSCAQPPREIMTAWVLNALWGTPCACRCARPWETRAPGSTTGSALRLYNRV